MVFEFGCYKLYSFNIANFKNKLVTCILCPSVLFEGLRVPVEDHIYLV